MSVRVILDTVLIKHIFWVKLIILLKYLWNLSFLKSIQTYFYSNSKFRIIENLLKIHIFTFILHG